MERIRHASTAPARTFAAALIAGAVFSAGPASGQELARRVAAAPDGWVRFSYEARPGVCGNGRHIRVDGERTIRLGRHDDECDCACDEGLVRIEMRVRGGTVRDLEAEVGGDWRLRSETVTDLGELPPGAAADYLLQLAESSRNDAGKEAIFPATLARGVEAWPRLLEIARNGSVPGETRRSALFWVGQEVGERATEGLESIVGSAADLEVREAAVFALSQQRNDEAVTALIRIARTHPEPEIRKRSIFWLGQRADDPRVLDFFEEILTSMP